MSKQKRPTQAFLETMAAFESGMDRVADYIRFRAKRDGGIWSHPWIPYYRLMGDLWGARYAQRVKPSGERLETLRAEVAMVQSYDVLDRGYRAAMDLMDAQDVVQLLSKHDFGTVDVDMLDKLSEGNGDMDDYYRLFRVGDSKVVTRGNDIVSVEQLRAIADGLREEAKSFDRIVELAGEPA